MANRYVWTYHTNTKWGVELGVSFMTAYCPDDQTAIYIAELLDEWLPNYGKVSCSRVIHEAGNFEIPNADAELTDVALVSLLLGNQENPTIRRTVKIPLAYVSSDGEGESGVIGLSEIQEGLWNRLCDPAGTPFNTTIGISIAPKNVIRGGPVNPHSSTDNGGRTIVGSRVVRQD